MAPGTFTQIMTLHALAASGLRRAQSDVCDELQGRTFGFKDQYCESARTYHNVDDLMPAFTSGQQYWEAQQRQKPWWSMLTGFPQTFDISDENKTHFFQMGSDDARTAMSVMKRHNAAPQMGTALDFGCGLGRVAQGFVAEGFNKIKCVDQSAFILNVAQSSLTAFGGKGPVLKKAAQQIEYVQSGPDLGCKVAKQTVDFVYSVLTLQTMKPQLQVAYIEQLCDALKLGGSGFFQTATSLKRYENGNGLKKEHCSLQADEDGRAMHFVSRVEITMHLLKRGCEVIYAYSCPKIGDQGESTCFAITKARRP